MAAPNTHDAHGNTPAAWTTVGLLLLGTFLICLAVVVTSIPLFVVGAVVAVAGLVAGRLMSLAGYGSARVQTPRELADRDRSEQEARDAAVDDAVR